MNNCKRGAGKVGLLELLFFQDAGLATSQARTSERAKSSMTGRLTALHLG